MHTTANSSKQTASLGDILSLPSPVLALAPMQGVTDLTFLNLIHRHGGADVYFTEYLRVYPTSHLIKRILMSVTHNTTGRPIIVQMIGNDIPALVRSARELEEQYPVAAIDLNLGCPAPVVYKKCAGGGLLRDPKHVDAILGALRDAISIKFTVKTRIGFDSPKVFDEFLKIFAKHSLDLLTVHARTVKEMYRGEAHYDYIAAAVAAVPCPVIANGDIVSARKAERVLKSTGAKGVMIGRGAIRNPWIFNQIRDHLEGKPVVYPTGRQVLQYVHDLFASVTIPDFRESSQVQSVKKHLNHLGQGIDPEGNFLNEMRRASSKNDLFDICRRYLDHNDPMSLEPFPIAPLKRQLESAQ